MTETWALADSSLGGGRYAESNDWTREQGLQRYWLDRSCFGARDPFCEGGWRRLDPTLVLIQ